MNHDLICNWLGLPPGTWPPDHYTLLGLEPGEGSAARIEHHVHERMERVRRYQLANPDVATEAMNRLAQALVCLTDPAARRTYDAALFPAATATAVLEPTRNPAPARNPLAWMFGAWTPTPPAPSAETKAQSPLANSETVEHAAAPVIADPLLETVRSSPTCRRGLNTKRALYYRVSRARHLQWLWDRVGRYLSDPAWKLTRPSEATDMIQLLGLIRDLLKNFPPLVGEVGQPGYHVLSLARQQQIVPTYKMFSPSQREILARDWKDGRALLAAHRKFLRQELRALRQRGKLGRVMRTVARSVNDHPGRMLFLLASAALCWAYYQQQSQLGERLAVLGAVVGINVTIWLQALRPARPPKPRVPAAAPRPVPVRPKVGRSVG